MNRNIIGQLLKLEMWLGADGEWKWCLYEKNGQEWDWLESGGRTIIGSLPVHVAFPAFGPAVFLASELTAESQAPAVDLIVKRVGS